MEQQIEVKTFEVRYECDVCKKGYMVYSGETLAIYPHQFKHHCTNCNHTQNFLTTYPHFINKPI